MKKFASISAGCVFLLSADVSVSSDAEIVDALLETAAISCDEMGVEREKIMNVVAALKAEILSRLKQGKPVQLDDFGTFYIERAETSMRTETKNQVPVQDVVRFKVHDAVPSNAEHSLPTTMVSAP